MIQFFSTKKIPQRAALLNFCRKISRHLPALEHAGEICVIFLSDGEIHRINKNFLKKNKATDVIAFRYRIENSLNSDPRLREDSTLNCLLPFGDIYISLDTAKDQANKGKYPLHKELALLILHGLLHLVGVRDKSAKQRGKMFSMQKRFFRRLAPSLSPPDFR